VLIFPEGSKTLIKICPLVVYKKPGTDVMIFKIFLPKNLANKLAFFAQNKAKLCKNWIMTLVFEKNANFLPKIGKICRKL
jgi:hypothetical protein